MQFTLIDLNQWARATHYRHYREQVPCSYAMTVSLDITALKQRLDAAGQKLYPALIYGLSKQVQAHPEFRMALDQQGRLGYWGTVHPSYTVFHSEDETFSTLWTEYAADYAAFLHRYQADQGQYGNCRGIVGKPEGEEPVFHISCLPWASFTAFQLQLPQEPPCLAPIFTIGKYEWQGDRLLLPLAIQVHHAVCDGFHVARLVDDLQVWMHSFTLQ